MSPKNKSEAVILATDKQSGAHKTWFSRAGLGFLAIAFIALTVVSSSVLKGFHIDLTENDLYTVSEGTKNILKKIDEPLNLYFFFSEKNSKDLASLRTYAQRVRELLQQYERLSDGKIKLHLIDPVPFSEDEDKAAQYGLQAVPVAADTEIYFGLVGTNAVDSKESIRFFQPDKEEFLEYDISKLIAKLSQKKAPVVGLLSGLPIKGGMDFSTQQPTPSWAVIEQLKQTFDLHDVAADVTEIPADMNLLILVQPKGMSDKSRFAIDQFVLRGGNLIVFTDPYAETDKLPAGQGNPFPQVMAGDDLNSLFKPWGISVSMNQIVGDADHALSVQAGQGQAPIRHLALLGLSGKDSGNDSISSGLEVINVGMAGSVQTLANATTTVTPILMSGSNAGLLAREKFAFLPDPSELQKDFVVTGQRYTIAARISGKVKSGFEKAPEGVTGEFLTESKSDIHVMIVADTDVLSDRYWVQVQNFFGQQVAQPFADNGNFVANAVEAYSGSSDLIGLRSRGRFARPFEKVASLRRDAEVEFRHREDELQKRLTDTERQLSDLQKRFNDKGEVQLSPQEEQALTDFQQQKVKVRKELREVQHQLNRDIEQLGTKLRIINMGAVPLLLIILASAMALSRRGVRRRARD